MLRTELTEKLKAAMKAQDKIRLEALRYVLALVKNAEIDKHAELTDEELVKLVASEVKKRKEAIEQIRGGGREELAVEEEAKVKVLQEFLPEQMSDAEVEKMVGEVIAAGTGDFGGVMKAVMGEVAGRADGKLVAEIVKRRLG